MVELNIETQFMRFGMVCEETFGIMKLKRNNRDQYKINKMWKVEVLCYGMVEW